MSEKSAAYDAAYKKVEALVTARKLDDAILAAADLVNMDTDRTAGWFILHLALRLNGQMVEADLAMGEARRCPDYSLLYEGDFVRDKLFDAIRRRQIPNDISNQLDRLRAQHDGDSNRMGCIYGLEGRYRYALGLYGQAVRLHEMAQAVFWDKQWEANNLLHWLKAAVMAGKSKPRLGANLYQRIRQMNQLPVTAAGHLSRGHVYRAWLAYRLGRFGCRLDDAFNWLYWRLPRR